MDYVLSHTLTNNLNSFKLNFENLPNWIFQFLYTIAWRAELKQGRTVPEREGMTKVSSRCSLIKFGIQMCWLCNNGKDEGWSKSRLVTGVLSVWTGEREKRVWLLFGFSLTSDLCIVCIPTRPRGTLGSPAPFADQTEGRKKNFHSLSKDRGWLLVSFCCFGNSIYFLMF